MRYKDEWVVTFYSNGLFLKTMYFMAYNRADALQQLHASGVRVIEILRCRKIG